MDTANAGPQSQPAVLEHRKFSDGQPLLWATDTDTGPISNKERTVRPIDSLTMDRLLCLAADFDERYFGYVVTSNIDQLLKYYQDVTLRAAYQEANFIVADSRLCALIVRLLTGARLPVCTGSDLVERVLSRIVSPMDRVVVVGGLAGQTQQWAVKYRLSNVRHHSLPTGATDNSPDTDKCVSFIERESPFRFCFLAVGSPQRELIAHQLRTRGIARGLVLCIGESPERARGRREPGSAISS